MKNLTSKIKECRLCGLCQSRTQAVPGEGCQTAELMIVGEAPGKNEDLKGLPFVGQSGKLLEELLAEIGIKREEVFITNVVKCRPPSNRNPEEVEVETCFPHLVGQVNLIQPRVILTLGAFAARMITNMEEPISKLRGRVFTGPGAPYVVPTFHPAYILRNRGKRDQISEDFKLVLKVLGRDKT